MRRGPTILLGCLLLCAGCGAPPGDGLPPRTGTGIVTTTPGAAPPAGPATGDTAGASTGRAPQAPAVTGGPGGSGDSGGTAPDTTAGSAPGPGNGPASGSGNGAATGPGSGRASGAPPAGPTAGRSGTPPAGTGATGPATRAGGAGEPQRKVTPRVGGAPPGGSIPDRLGGGYTFEQYRAEVALQCRPAGPDCVTVVLDEAGSPPGATRDWLACAASPAAGTPLATIAGTSILITVGYSECYPPDGLPEESAETGG